MSRDRKVTVAVVPASMAIYEEIESYLHRAGYDCKLLKSDRHLESKLEADTAIDLLIMPLGEKGGPEIEALKQVRRNQRLCCIPIILVGEICDLGAVAEAKQFGACSVCAQPLSEIILMSRIQACLKNGKKTVLLIDDEPTILEVLSLHLELERFVVLTAGTAEDGLKVLEEQTVHAVVSDILLPNMDGMEFLVRSKERWPTLPVFLMTGHSGRFTSEAAIAAGADGWFAKPFHNLDMVRALRQAIRQAQFCCMGGTASQESESTRAKGKKPIAH